MSDNPPYEIRDDEHGIGSVFIPRSPWRDDYSDLMAKQGIKALRLPTPGYGFAAQSIDFVAELDFLRSVEVYTYGITDLAPLSKLGNVEVLGLQLEKAVGIENWRPPLRVLLARWTKQLAPLLATSTLEYVNISNYPYVDLEKMQTPSLRRLALTSRKLVSLAGVAKMPHIERVDLYNCPNLISVDDLKVVQTMKTLEVEACKHIARERVVTQFSE